MTKSSASISFVHACSAALALAVALRIIPLSMPPFSLHAISAAAMSVAPSSSASCSAIPATGTRTSPSPPHLTGECAQNRGLLRGRDCDGGVIPQELCEEAATVVHPDEHGRFGARDGEPVVCGGDVGEGVTDGC